MYDHLRKEIAAALNWSEKDVNSLSMASLRELVRPSNPALAQRIAECIAKGNHIAPYPARRR